MGGLLVHVLLCRGIDKTVLLRALQTQFLAELGIVAENPGFYNGSWGGSGSIATSVNPATGEAIATVRQATVEEYEGCVAAMSAAQEAWQLVRLALSSSGS